MNTLSSFVKKNRLASFLVWGLVALIVVVANWRWWAQMDQEEPEPVLETA